MTFTITLEDVEALWPADNCCPVCRVVFDRSKRSGALPSIDRIDNYQGYTLENTHICCLRCNGRKSNHAEIRLLEGRAGLDWQNWARRRAGLPEVSRVVLHDAAQPSDWTTY